MIAAAADATPTAPYLMYPPPIISSIPLTISQHDHNWRQKDDNAPDDAEKGDNERKPLRSFKQQGHNNEGKRAISNDHAVSQSVDPEFVDVGQRTNNNGPAAKQH